MISIRGETIHSTDYNTVLRWLLDDFRYLDFLHADTDTPELLSDAARFILTNYGTDSYDSFVGFENMVKSAELIRKAPGVDILQDRFKGYPAIIALSGPSLNKQLPYLREVKDKAIIIAADTALKVLESAGISPHFVCKKERFDNTTAAVEGKHRSILVLCPVCNPDVFRRYEGPIMIGFRDYAHFNWLPFNKGWLRKPGTVGNMCFNLAELLGCSPIVLVGADHAFQGKQTHASGAEAYISDQVGRVSIPGYYGGMVTSKPEFADAVRIFSEDAKRRGDVINATEGGALIEHAKNVPFRQALAWGFRPNIDHSRFRIEFDVPAVDWATWREDTASRVAKIAAKAEQGLEGNATVGDVVNLDPWAWNTLIIHIIQPYHLVWMIDRGNLGEWFTVVRDAARMVEDVIRNTRMV